MRFKDQGPLDSMAHGKDELKGGGRMITMRIKAYVDDMGTVHPCIEHTHTCTHCKYMHSAISLSA